MRKSSEEFEMTYFTEDRQRRLSATNTAIRALRGIGIHVSGIALGNGNSLPQLTGHGNDAQLSQLAAIAQNGVSAPQFDSRAFAVVGGALAIINMKKES
jgi:hypothetical protein